MRIAYHKYCLPSARLLRDSIQELTGIHLFLTNAFSTAQINYGNGDVESKFNSADFIQLCSSKLLFSKTMAEKGFFVPIFSKRMPVESDFPIMVRTTLSACGGKGIIIVPTLAEYSQRPECRQFFWTKFIRITKEYRAHFIGGEFKKVFEKVCTVENESKYPVRNIGNDYHFKLINKPEVFGKLNELEIQLAQALGDNCFCGIDLGWAPEEKKYFIFEANSAPGLNSHTVVIYAKFLCERLGLKLLGG